jgi:hypothetical protein
MNPAVPFFHHNGSQGINVAPFVDKTLCFVPLCLYYGFIGDNAEIKPKMIGEQRITVCLTP